MKQIEDLQAAVHQAMDNATDNGYDLTHGWHPEEIAEDIGTYDPDLEGRPAEELLPHVKSWLDKRGYDPEALPFGLSEKERA